MFNLRPVMARQKCRFKTQLPPNGQQLIPKQSSAAAEVASIDSQGNATFNRVTQSGSGGSFIVNQNTLQPGTTFYVSSGTAVNFNTTNLKFADGTTQTTASSGGAGGTITGVTAGYGISGGGTSGNVAVNLMTNSTSYIQNTSSLQSGTTFYVSSGTATNFHTTTLQFADGTTQTTASQGGSITGITAGMGLAGGGSSGVVSLSLVPNSTNYIQNTNTLQSGTTFYVSSGTVVNFNATNLKFADGTSQNTASQGGTLTGVTAGYGISGGGTSGNVAVNLVSNSTSYIQNTSALQSGATFYVSSGTATNLNTTTLKFADGTSQTTAGGMGTLTGVTAGAGLTGGGISGNVMLSLAAGGPIYIQNTSTLQTGATFYVSSGTVSGQFSSGHLAGVSPSPTVAVGAGAGAAATASLTGSDTAGEITLNAGAAPTVSATIVTVTFNTGYNSTAYVVFSPTNNQSALLSAANGIYATSTSTTFSLVAGVTAITASVTYKWHYIVIQ